MKTDDPRKKQILESLKGGLIVSCQVQHDDPIYTDNMVVKMLDGQELLVFAQTHQNKSKQSKKRFLNFQ